MNSNYYYPQRLNSSSIKYNSKNTNIKYSQNNSSIFGNNQKKNINSLARINTSQKNCNLKTSTIWKNKNPQNNLQNQSNKFLCNRTEKLIQQKRTRGSNHLKEEDHKVSNFNNYKVYKKQRNSNVSYKENSQTTNTTCYNVLKYLLKYLLNIKETKKYYFNQIKFNDDKSSSIIKLSELVENNESLNEQKLKDIIQSLGPNNKDNVPNLLDKLFTSISEKNQENKIIVNNFSRYLLNRNKLNENIINKLFLGCYQLNWSWSSINKRYSYYSYSYNYYILLKPEIIYNQKHDISLQDYINLYFNKKQDNKNLTIYESPEILIILIQNFEQSKIKIKFNKFLSLNNFAKISKESSAYYEFETISYSKGNFNIIKNKNDNNFDRDDKYLYKSKIANENDYYVLFYIKKNIKNDEKNEVINEKNKEDKENQKKISKIKNRGKTIGKNILKPEENIQPCDSRSKETSVEKNLLKNKLNSLKKELNIETENEKNSNKIEPKGLVNFGLNCYMNSLLQCFYYIKELREEFIMNKNKYKKDQKVCKAFAEVMYRLKYENANYTDAKEFKNIMGDKNNLFKGCKAADVKDLFINLIDAFIGELSKDDDNESIYNEPNYTDKIEMFQEAEREVDENIVINKLFLGYYETDYLCPDIKNIHIYSFQEQTFLLFELLLISKYYETKNLTLKKCFEFYFSREDKLSTFDCSKCHKTHKNNCIEKIYKLPEILVIALDRGYGKAFQGDVKFKTELNLNEDLNNCIDRDNKENVKNIFYKLICISTHSGNSSASGHYTSCCQTDNGKYYYFSDTYVHEINEKNLYEDEPYLLFYKKIIGNTDNDNGFNNIENRRKEMQNILDKFIKIDSRKYIVDYYCKKQSPFIWKLTIIGPKNTPYENGLFNFKINFPVDEFPSNFVNITTLETKIYHANFGQDKKLLFEFNNNSKNYDQLYEGIKDYFNYIYNLFKEPDINKFKKYKENKDLQDEYLKNIKSYNRQAQRTTDIFAKLI